MMTEDFKNEMHNRAELLKWGFPIELVHELTQPEFTKSIDKEVNHIKHVLCSREETAKILSIALNPTLGLSPQTDYLPKFMEKCECFVDTLNDLSERLAYIVVIKLMVEHIIKYHDITILSERQINRILGLDSNEN